MDKLKQMFGKGRKRRPGREDSSKRNMCGDDAELSFSDNQNRIAPAEKKVKPKMEPRHRVKSNASKSPNFKKRSSFTITKPAELGIAKKKKHKKSSEKRQDLGMDITVPSNAGNDLALFTNFQSAVIVHPADVTTYDHSTRDIPNQEVGEKEAHCNPAKLTPSISLLSKNVGELSAPVKPIIHGCASLPETVPSKLGKVEKAKKKENSEEGKYLGIEMTVPSNAGANLGLFQSTDIAAQPPDVMAYDHSTWDIPNREVGEEEAHGDPVTNFLSAVIVHPPDVTTYDHSTRDIPNQEVGEKEAHGNPAKLTPSISLLSKNVGELPAPVKPINIASVVFPEHSEVGKGATTKKKKSSEKRTDRNIEKPQASHTSFLEQAEIYTQTVKDVPSLGESVNNLFAKLQSGETSLQPDATAYNQPLVAGPDGTNYMDFFTKNYNNDQTYDQSYVRQELTEPPSQQNDIPTVVLDDKTTDRKKPEVTEVSVTWREQEPNVLAVSLSVPKRYRYVMTGINQSPQCYPNIILPTESGEYSPLITPIGPPQHRRNHDMGRSEKVVAKNIRYAISLDKK